MKENITYEQFIEATDKLDIRMGHIDSVEVVSNNGKFLKLDVDFGEEGYKTVVTNLGKDFSPLEFEGRTLPFMLNMPAREISGHMSEAMILVGDILMPPGTKLT